MIIAGQLPNTSPLWLSTFLTASYFQPCPNHRFTKNERNHFCIDCIEGPLCSRGLQDHTGHHTLQVRKASHADGVRVENVNKLLDISGIQTYTINNHKILFLVRESKGKFPARGGTARRCLTCGRTLADNVKFCSIRCKLMAAQNGIDGVDASSLSLLPETSPSIINATTTRNVSSPYTPETSPYDIQMAMPADKCSEDDSFLEKMQSTKKSIEMGRQIWFPELHGDTIQFTDAAQRKRKLEFTLPTPHEYGKVDTQAPIVSPISVLQSMELIGRASEPSLSVRDTESHRSSTAIFHFQNNQASIDLGVSWIQQMLQLSNYRRRSRKSSPHRSPLC